MITVKCIAAYDFGTSGVKAALVSEEGKILAVQEKGYPLYKPQPLYVEQDPKDYWDAVCEVTHGVLANSGAMPEDVKALSFSVQAVNIIPVDKDGNVLHNAISWLDGRAEKQAEEINTRCGMDLVRSQDHQSRLLWIKENRPDIYEKTAYFLDCNSFLQYKATGVMAVEHDHPGIAKKDPMIQAYIDATYADIDAEKLGPTVAACEKYDVLDEKGASDLGLIEGTPVFGGMIDVTAASAGCGCCKEGDAHIYLGSSGWMSALISQACDGSEGSYLLDSIDPKLLIYGGCTNSCCLMFDWVIDKFYHKEKEELGSGIYELIDEEVAKVPAGCEGLHAAPWLFGEQFPITDPYVRAMFFNISEKHTRAHFIRAVLESLCFSMRGQIDLYRKDAGKDISEISVNGGGSLSSQWMQIMADVLQMPVHVPEETRHSGAVGAAIAAAVGLGWCDMDDTGRFIGVDKSYSPDVTKAELYTKKYKLFYEIYDMVKDLSKKMEAAE